MAGCTGDGSTPREAEEEEGHLASLQLPGDGLGTHIIRPRTAKRKELRRKCHSLRSAVQRLQSVQKTQSRPRLAT